MEDPTGRQLDSASPAAVGSEKYTTTGGLVGTLSWHYRNGGSQSSAVLRRP